MSLVLNMGQGESHDSELPVEHEQHERYCTYTCGHVLKNAEVRPNKHVVAHNVDDLKWVAIDCDIYIGRRSAFTIITKTIPDMSVTNNRPILAFDRK